MGLRSRTRCNFALRRLEMQDLDAHEPQHRRDPQSHAFDFWLARGAVVVVAALQFLRFNDFSIGPRWLAPTIELALLVPLSFATAWAQSKAKHASTGECQSREWQR